MLKLPRWSDRIAALWRHREAALRIAGLSRKRDENFPKSAETLRIGGALVELATGRVCAPDGTETTLRRQSAMVLRVLAARQGRNVSKDELFREVWPGIAVTDDSLVQCVGDIRRAIGNEGHRVLQTLLKRGYRLVQTADDSNPGNWAQLGLSWRIAAGVLLLLPVLAFAGWTLQPNRTGAGLPTFAALPFEDLSGEPRWTRLGRGLAAEIGADLARGRGIVVIPAETAETAANEPLSAAETLGVRFVLDGTIDAEGEDLRVTARLTDALGGTVVWSDRWTRRAEDVFAVQEEIVERIDGTLDGIWTGMLAQVVRAGAERRPTRSLKAYELFLLGAEAKHQFTPEAFAEAVAYLRRALEIDPDFVQAMVTLSIVYSFQADYAADDTAATAMIEASFRLAERSTQISPDDPNALNRLANVRVLQGRRAEAWPLAARAVEIAPTNPDVLAIAAWTYYFSDHGRAPREWAERAIALNPGHPDWYNCGLAMTALFADDLDLARRAAREAPPLAEMLVALGAAEALAGNVEDARVWFARFKAETRYRSLSSLYYQRDLSDDPAMAPLVRGARLAGFPVSEAEVDRASLR